MTWVVLANLGFFHFFRDRPTHDYSGSLFGHVYNKYLGCADRGLSYIHHSRPPIST